MAINGAEIMELLAASIELEEKKRISKMKLAESESKLQDFFNSLDSQEDFEKIRDDYIEVLKESLNTINESRDMRIRVRKISEFIGHE